MIFLRRCFANSSPKGNRSSFQLRLFDEYVSSTFYYGILRSAGFVLQPVETFPLTSSVTGTPAAPSVLNCNSQLQCGLVSSYSLFSVCIPDWCFHSWLCRVHWHPSLVWLPCGVAGFPRSWAQQCESAPKSGMQLILSQFRGLGQHHTLHFFRKGPGIWEEGSWWDLPMWALLETPCEPACDQWDWLTQCRCYTKGTTNATSFRFQAVFRWLNPFLTAFEGVLIGHNAPRQATKCMTV